MNRLAVKLNDKSKKEKKTFEGDSHFVLIIDLVSSIFQFLQVLSL